MLKHEHVTTTDVPLFIALALGGASLGYFLGRGFAPPVVRSVAGHKPDIERKPASGDLGENKGEGEGDDSDAEADGDLGQIQAEPTEECKLVRTLNVPIRVPRDLDLILLPVKILGTFRSSWYGTTLI